MHRHDVLDQHLATVPLFRDLSKKFASLLYEVPELSEQVKATAAQRLADVSD